MDEQHSLEGKRRKKKNKQQHEEVKLEITFSQRGSKERIAEDENPKKLCTICKKEFGSGKALGGHMRIHAQDSSSQKNIKRDGFSCGDESGKKNNSNYGFQSSGTPACHVCQKVFHSWKSLYGHMRCHPERQWRGVPVPFDKSGHDPVRIRVGPDAGARNGSRRGVDLLSEIARWPVTGKRGRGCSLPVAELDILEAAQNLLWLAAGPGLWDGEGFFYKRKRMSECTAGKGSFCYEEIGVRIEKERSSVLLDNRNNNNQKMDQPGNCCLIPKNGSASELNDNGINGFQVAVEDVSIEGKKEKKKRGRKKKVRVEIREETKDPIANEAPDPAQQIRPIDPVIMPGPGGGFRCVTCRKEFSTYQALGGHRSKHYKEKNGVESCFCHPGPGPGPNPENGSTATDCSAEQGSHYLAGEVWAVTPWEAAGQTGRIGLVVEVNHPAATECP